MNPLEYIELVRVDHVKARMVVEEADFWFNLLNNHSELKEEISLNKKLPDEVLMELAKDLDDDIRFTVAMKRRLPIDIFELLSQDRSESVRLAIARNPKAPREILQKLEEDSWEEIRSVVIDKLER